MRKNTRAFARVLISVSTVILSAIFFCSIAMAEQKTILVQSTTSTANSGFYRYLLPKFERQSGIRVNVVAVGTGQAIRNARNCDADVLLVHAKEAELEFVANGYGVQRFDLMYNDFVIIGPATDPANIQGQTSVQSALSRIAESNALFASRGDDSGTNKKEQVLWQSSGIDLAEHTRSWYRSTGSGMGATINTAIGLGAYTLTDRATWISFKNKQDFKILFEGDTALFNQYGVVLVNSEKCPSVSQAAAQQFIDWLRSDATQHLIAAFEVDGQQLFYPNAKP